MGYTVKGVAERLHLTAHAVRYYERAGLLPAVGRDEHGNRVFDDKDIEWVTLVCCLRDTGMSVANIKHYVDLCRVGDDTVAARRQIISDHKQAVEEKIAQLQQYMTKIDKKLQYYDDLVINRGQDCCNPCRKAQ